MSAAGTLLSVQRLGVVFDTPRGPLHALQDVSIDVRRGSTLAIVGESGSGKSVLSRAVMRLLAPSAKVAGDAAIEFDGIDLLGLSKDRMRKVRGRRIAMVFQDPMTALNPVRTIGAQLEEGLKLQLGLASPAARARAHALLGQVGIPAPGRRMQQYPHELSGGMRQRVVIAMAIACEPELLIADEPTTALDVTVQAEILELLKTLQAERSMTVILITHDLGVAASQADEVAVMYAGQVVEQAATARLLADPRMPYTAALLRSIPTLSDPPHAQLFTIPGRPPVVMGEQAGCRFAPRCTRSIARCTVEMPVLTQADDASHRLRCWNPIAPGQAA